MTPEMKKFIDLLESELGYSEKAGAYTKFGDWYGKNIEFDADYSSAPWCDMYLSWAAHKLGYEDWVGQFAWTVAHAEWFQEQDAWGKTPKPGAFVFYDWSGGNDVDDIDHVGIVTRVEGDTIYTIEGNIDGGVAKRKERDTSKVVGYGYPEKIKSRLDRQAEQERKEEEAVQDKASTGLPGDSDSADQTLSAQIPNTQVVQPPLAAPRETPDNAASTKPGAQKPRQETPGTQKPATKSSTAPEQASEAAQKSKKGKHAKPATADTNAATTAPLPVIVDAPPASSTSALGTPALVGSALIAALAVLAVAKTRQLRVRPAVESPAKTPKRGRRRRPRRSLIAPARAARPEPTTQREAAHLELTAQREAAHLELTAQGDATLLETSLQRHAALPEVATEREAALLETSTPLAATSMEVGLSRRESVRMEAKAVAAEAAVAPPMDTANYVFSEDTGALPRIFETGSAPRVSEAPSGDLDRLTARALENLDAATARASEPFDPFTPRIRPSRKAPGSPTQHQGSAQYQGRRRRGDLPAELTPQDTPAGGRRHRTAAQATFVGDILDTPEAFIQTAPLRGRRHRGHAEAPADTSLLATAGGRHRA